MDKDNHDFGSRIGCFVLIVFGIKWTGKFESGIASSLRLSRSYSVVALRTVNSSKVSYVITRDSMVRKECVWI